MRDGHRPQHLADRADAVEPCVAREIIGPRQRHGRRRREPGPELNLRVRRYPLRKLILVDRHSDERWKRWIMRFDQEPDCSPGSKVLNGCHCSAHVSHYGTIESRLRDPIGADPDQGAAE